MDAMGLKTASSQVTPSPATNNSVSESRARELATPANSSLDRANNRSNEEDRRRRLSEEQDRRNQQNLSNVVSRSSDGDTVQVDPNTARAVRMANEGNVISRSSDAQNNTASNTENTNATQSNALNSDKTASEEAARKEAERKRDSRDEQAKITSFAGYTKSQIETLYQQGRISRQDYEKQIALREERASQVQGNNSQMAREAARLNGTMTQAQMDAQAIRGAFSDGANQNPISPADRIQAMANVSERNTNQRQQQQTAVISEGRRQWDYQLQA